MSNRGFIEENEASRRELGELIARLDDRSFRREVGSGWTVSTLLCHLAFWDQRVLFLLRQWQSGQFEASPLSVQSTDSINVAVRAISQAVPGPAAAELAFESATAVDAQVNDPAGKALVQIGEPSVGPVAQVLEQGNRQARWRAALILMSIGTPAAIRAVRSHIPKENDPHLRPFMEGLFKRERAPKGVGKAGPG